MLEIFRTFINRHYKGKTGERQAEAALKLWEKHTKQNPHEAGHQDVDSLISKKLEAPIKKDRLTPKTLSLYLLYIAKFYDWLARGKPHLVRYTTLAEYIMEKSNQLVTKEIADEANSVDHKDVLKMLIGIRELLGKLLVRLLVFSKIPIGCLNSLRVREIYDKRKYQTYCKGRTIEGDLYSDTPEIISEYIEKNELKNNDKLINISERHIQNLIPDYAHKIGIEKKVTPRDLRKFGKNLDLRNWLIEEYEKTKKESKRKKSTGKTQFRA